MSFPAELLTRRRLIPCLALTLPLGCFLWAFWPTFLDLLEAWRINPQYSHGYLVPLFAGVLLWLRRERLDLSTLQPSWWGLPLLLAGLALRLAGAFFYYVWFDALALLPTIAGLCLMLGGRSAWRWAWPSILFLGFMIPMPYRLATAMSGPLQRLATIASTFTMQTLGMPALSEGNIILLDDYRIGIVEACNGLNMLVVFFALATAVALLIKKPWLDRTLILTSAVPIALFSNIARIVVTGILYRTTDSETANAFFHDLAGWIMMPLALGILWLELKMLDALFIDPEVATPGPRGTTRPNQTGARKASTKRATRTTGQRVPASKRTPGVARSSPRPTRSAPGTEESPVETASLPKGG